MADASPVAQAAQAPPAAAELRFAVRACDVCVAEQLVFLGTEAGPEWTDQSVGVFGATHGPKGHILKPTQEV